MADDTKTVLVGANNELYDFPEENVAKALAKGFRRETKEEAKARVLKEWAQDNPSVAAIAGAARGSTLGASDVIGSALGGKEKLKAAKDEWPKLSLGSEIVGSVGATLGSMGTGAVGTGARAAGILAEARAAKAAASVLKVATAPAQAAMGAGRLVGSQASKIVSNELAKKAVATAAAGATEALLYNIGSNVSEQALGDANYSAEKLLAHSGTALALGGGLSLGGMALAAGASKARGAVSRVKDLVNNRVSAVDDAVNGADSVLDSLADTYAAASSKVTGLSKDATKRFVQLPGTPEGMAAREAALNKLTRQEKEAFISAATKDYGEMFDEIGKLARQADDNIVVTARSTLKDLKTQRGRMPVDPDPAAWAAYEANRGSALVKETQNLTADLTQTSLAADALVQTKKLSKQAVQGLDDALNVFKQAQKKGDALDVFDAALAADKNLAKLSKAGGAINSAADRQFLQQARDKFNSFTMNEAVFGDAAAALSTSKQMRNLYDSLGAADGSFVKNFGRVVNGEVRVDPAKVAAHIGKSIKATGKLQNEALDEFFETAEKVMALSEKQDSLKRTMLDAGALSSLTSKARSSQVEAAKRMKSDALLGDATSAAGSGVNDLVTGALAGAVGGPVGVAAAGVYKLLKDPVAAGKLLLTLERVMLSSEGRVAQAVQSLTSATKKAGKLTINAASRASVPVSVGVMRSFANSMHNPEDGEIRRKKAGETKRLADFRALEPLLEQITTDPERAFARYDAAFSALGDVTPELKGALVQKQLEAGAFLASKMPRNPSKGQTLNPAINDWQPSDQEMAVFERYVKAAHDPLSVLDDLKAGTITRESVTTLQALYPQLYGTIKNNLVENLATMQVKLPYSQRINLSTLFGLPVDDTMTPAFISQMQVFYAGKTQSASQGAQGKRGGTPPKLGSGFRKFSDSVMTETQKVSFGRGR